MTDLPPLRVEVLDDTGVVVDDILQADVELSTPNAAGLAEVRIDVVNVTDRPFAGHVRLVVDVPAAAEPWWLIPGLFYGENRPEDCQRRFPRFAVGGHDPAGMVSDHWSFRADRAATPAVFAWGSRGGAAIITSEQSPCGLAGVGFSHAGDVASAHVVFPFREAPVTYYGFAEPRPAEVSRFVWAPGQRVQLRAAVTWLPAERQAYAPVLRSVYEQNRDAHPVRPWVSVEEAADLAAEGLLRWHYDPDPGVLLETVGFDRGVSDAAGAPVDRQAMHVGWVSGIPWAYALLAHGRRHGRADEIAAAERVIGFVCANLSPSGTFWGRWERASGWTQSWTPVPGGLHARTLAEATLFLARAVELGEDGRSPAEWTAAAKSNLDAVAGRQRDDGNLGALHHAETGEVLSWAGAAGLTWIPAFIEAERWDDDGRYLAAARLAGDYYARFIEDEFICGAPEDVDLAPTSEDGYAAVMAYVALHRRTGEARWLGLARRAADWMLTFRYTYNVSFPPRTLLGAYGFATRGADQASPSNQHLAAYGMICTRELFELAEATGDPHYRDRAVETLACFRQLLARQDGELNAYRGMISERYYQTSCFQPKGMVLTLSHAWSVGVLLLGCEQELSASL